MADYTGRHIIGAGVAWFVVTILWILIRDLVVESIDASLPSLGDAIWFVLLAVIWIVIGLALWLRAPP